ncbi:hypothetical protein HMJ29_16980 [Hymenobacter taeanensis]|uniref:Uncharacterized protein n=1 Tax=Hymenobacter taeanensis TaxID=2735321 RepID=A0A6M6BKE1_9BACT|nr:MULTISPECIES: hypothetical protein [Hymenobacter]QJX48517.1 hypothetical protein HMJ29_16980 [Hymenobacter taeanensis]UOQ81985.1 hypothetical protein MUN83_04130 [Hymenobacter sp. 5414T-23]
MFPTEDSFRTALQKGQMSTAAILLAQLIVARYEQHAHLGLVQEVQVHQYCAQLLEQGASMNADTLLEAAQQYMPA